MNTNKKDIVARKLTNVIRSRSAKVAENGQRKIVTPAKLGQLFNEGFTSPHERAIKILLSVIRTSVVSVVTAV
ncbi:MAG: hypothetical protein V7L20_14260 [Nostoc sp.]